MRPKADANEVIGKLKEIYGVRYDFSKSVYNGAYNDIEVICPKHGSFFSTPYNLKRGNRGCPQCVYERADKINILREKFPHISFDKSVYKGCDKPITAVCSKHGEFTNKYDNIKKSVYGCQQCALELGYRLKVKLTKSERIALLREIHPQYNFNKSVYAGTRGYIDVECPKHGLFKVNYRCCYENKQGCPRCSKLTPNERIDVLREIFPQYDFSKSIYTGVKGKIIVICPEHGKFSIQYGSMRDRRTGCQKCRVNPVKQIQELEEMFPQYSFEKAVYTKGKNKIEVICHKHGSFFIKYNNMKAKRQGCARCVRGRQGSALEESIRKHIQDTHNVLCERNISIIESKVREGCYLEIDMLIEQLSLGFEFNGEYWHSERAMEKRWSEKKKAAYGDMNGYHQHKFDECKKKGIDLYFINEEDYIKDKEGTLAWIDAIITTRIAELNNQEPKMSSH